MITSPPHKCSVTKVKVREIQFLNFLTHTLEGVASDEERELERDFPRELTSEIVFSFRIQWTEMF